MRAWSTLAAVAVFGAAAFTPEPAQAQHTVTCESRNDSYRACNVTNLDESSVRLVRRLSDAACVNGRSWGTEPGRIWVDNGCRAEFEYERSFAGSGGGRDSEITCESRNDRLQNCRIPGLDETSVRLVERLSSAACINGRTWGTQPGLIWVESGCRARFTFETNRGGGGFAQSNDNRNRRELTCESRNDGYRECPVRNLDLSSVEMERQLSSARCVKDQSWGASRDRSGRNLVIWVDNGCRAVFSYRVN